MGNIVGVQSGGIHEVPRRDVPPVHPDRDLTRRSALVRPDALCGSRCRGVRPQLRARRRTSGSRWTLPWGSRARLALRRVARVPTTRRPDNPGLDAVLVGLHLRVAETRLLGSILCNPGDAEFP